MPDFDQTAYDHASSLIQDLSFSGRTDLLARLAEEIKSAAPDAFKAKRGRPKKSQ
ncbi:MAG TPA: hypothetical protein V6D29_03580 [Leptolyngbyaceae cyanobacterium]